MSSMRKRLDDKKPPVAERRPPPLLPSVDGRNVIRALKLDQPLEEEKYEKLLERWRSAQDS